MVLASTALVFNSLDVNATPVTNSGTPAAVFTLSSMNTMANLNIDGNTGAYANDFLIIYSGLIELSVPGNEIAFSNTTNSSGSISTLAGTNITILPVSAVPVFRTLSFTTNGVDTLFGWIQYTRTGAGLSSIVTILNYGYDTNNGGPAHIGPVAAAPLEQGTLLTLAAGAAGLLAWRNRRYAEAKDKQA